MGLCVDSDENDQGMDFEIRRESVIFTLEDGENVEISKMDLYRINALLSDEKWGSRLLELIK